jgi:CDP-paratose synthetase
LGSQIKMYFESLGFQVLCASFASADRDNALNVIRTYLMSSRIVAFINAGACQLRGDDPDSLKLLVDSNVLVPALICSLIRTHSPSTKFIHFGSSWQIDYKGKSSPMNAYASSKSAAEEILRHYSLEGLQIVSLRLFEVYGCNDNRKKILNLLIDSIAGDLELPTTRGQQALDFIYVTDVVKAVALVATEKVIAETRSVRIFSIRSGRTTTILDLIALICDVANKTNFSNIKTGKLKYRDRERFKLPYYVDKVPGWYPLVSLEDGVRMVYKQRTESMSKKPATKFLR